MRHILISRRLQFGQNKEDTVTYAHIYIYSYAHLCDLSSDRFISSSPRSYNSLTTTHTPLPFIHTLTRSYNSLTTTHTPLPFNHTLTTLLQHSFTLPYNSLIPTLLPPLIHLSLSTTPTTLLQHSFTLPYNSLNMHSYTLLQQPIQLSLRRDTM